MDTTSRRLAEVVDRLDIEEFATNFGLSQLPERDTMAMHRNHDSLYVYLPKSLCDDHIDDLDQPGDANVVYWRELGVAMIDLNDDEDGGLNE